MIHFLLVSFPTLLLSNVRLPDVLADGMMLQQKSTIKLWGWADAREQISIHAGWSGQTVETVADASGKWMVRIKSGEAGGPYTISIKGKNEITLNNVLLGEVWICSGQSNMEFTINMLGGWDSLYKKEKAELSNADYSQIRLCQIRKASATQPADTCHAQWKEANVTSVADFSATAWFYAKALYDKLKIPVGVISSSWGGSPAESWTPEEAVKNNPQLAWMMNVPNGSVWWPGEPGSLYNAMIHPLINYSIRGAIWYQGETNRLDADIYTHLFTTMIQNWRKAWDVGDFPFYFVQIAPYNYDEGQNSTAFLREAQTNALKLKNTGMAVTMDIGNVNDIHPKNKMEVGRRLALCALSETYKQKNISFSGPQFRFAKPEGNKLRLFFSNSHGLYCTQKQLSAFTISGPDEIFLPAVALIEDTTVLLSNALITNPVAARYAFDDTTSSDLFNKNGLPCPSFRTDDYPFLYRKTGLILNYDSLADAMRIELTCKDPAMKLHYSINNAAEVLYNGPFIHKESFQITARAGNSVTTSFESISGSFIRHKAFAAKSVQLIQNSTRYAGNKNLLTDGIRGSNGYWDHAWQGYEGTDFEIIIDLHQAKQINSVTVGLLENPRDWIMLPVKIECSSSNDGINFSIPVTTMVPENKNMKQTEIKDIKTELTTNSRYLRIKAFNMGVMPEWHPGKGGKPWIFVDEIMVD